MIRVTRESLVDLSVDGVIRPIRSDLSPVSAASRDLGVAGGEAVERRLSAVGPLPVGGAVVTPGGSIAAGFMIHVVVMSEDEPQTGASVERAVRNGLRRAADLGLASVALPPLGLGVGVAEPEDSAAALLGILRDHLAEKSPPHELSIVVTSEYESDVFTRLLEAPSRGSGG